MTTCTVTPTDRPKSVLDRCVIKVFGAVFYVVSLGVVAFFDFSVGVGAFVTGLSQISSFFSHNGSKVSYCLYLIIPMLH